jgi:hypothetical protein
VSKRSGFLAGVFGAGVEGEVTGACVALVRGTAREPDETAAGPVFADGTAGAKGAAATDADSATAFAEGARPSSGSAVVATTEDALGVGVTPNEVFISVDVLALGPCADVLRLRIIERPPSPRTTLAAATTAKRERRGDDGATDAATPVEVAADGDETSLARTVGSVAIRGVSGRAGGGAKPVGGV